MGLLDGKVTLITGASRGIGAASAKVFADEGASVVLVARSEAAIASIADAIAASGGKALAVAADVTDATSFERAISRTLEVFGRLDAAFNNAGTGHRPKPLADIDLVDFEAAIKSNLTGIFVSMQAEIRTMLAQGGGAIVNMASTAGLQGAPGMSPYAAAKHGVVGLTKVASLDYAAKGIRINALAPGPIDTHGFPEAVRQYIGGLLPVGRVGTPVEVAHAAAWLCSDQASFVHGAVLPIDGGRLAGVSNP